MPVSLASIVLTCVASDRISLAQKIILFQRVGFDSDETRTALNTAIQRTLEPLDAQATLQLWEECEFTPRFRELLISKITPGSLTYNQVVAYLTNEQAPYYVVTDALMGVIDWKSISKHRLMQTIGLSRSRPVWKKLVLDLGIFNETEILELCTGYWRKRRHPNKFFGPSGDFWQLALASPLVSKPDKVRLATEHASTHQQGAFHYLLENKDFTDEELIEIANNAPVRGIWSIVLPCLKQYRYLLKAARRARSEESWRIFIEKTHLEQKHPAQILRVARVSRSPQIWSMYLKQGSKPLVTHYELMQIGTEAESYALWAVLLAHLDYSKLNLDWVTEFVQGTLKGAERDTPSQRDAKSQATTVLCANFPWETIPQQRRLELLCMYTNDPWQEAIAHSLDGITFDQFVERVVPVA